MLIGHAIYRNVAKSKTEKKDWQFFFLVLVAQTKKKKTEKKYQRHKININT